MPRNSLESTSEANVGLSYLPLLYERTRGSSRVLHSSQSPGSAHSDPISNSGNEAFPLLGLPVERKEVTSRYTFSSSAATTLGERCCSNRRPNRRPNRCRSRLIELGRHHRDRRSPRRVPPLFAQAPLTPGFYYFTIFTRLVGPHSSPPSL